MTEKQIIQKIRNGDDSSYRKLFEENYNRLFRFMMQFSKKKDYDEVEEWVQKAFIKAFYGLSNFNLSSKFKTWLFTIAINEMKQEMGLLRNKLNSDEELDNHLIEEYANEFEWHYDMKIILEQISAEKKAVFILFEIEGYSHNEIANMLDISYAASRTILSRTKKELQTIWQKEFGK
ncbi:MAG: RNA polymerase sigma factor [Melioribacteraceae bacterium]|nr:RNA polymerase sigma factor [Melioribacteraceae bacterium]MCF8266105.1 RNA polymerase sigma factor [Melioribacteraceae bacterium]MCF8430829.1 RNA polymerase sigma factor [Melioribacteraceae bacterium]